VSENKKPKLRRILSASKGGIYTEGVKVKYLDLRWSKWNTFHLQYRTNLNLLQRTQLKMSVMSQNVLYCLKLHSENCGNKDFRNVGTLHNTTRRHNAEDSDMNTHRCKNLNSRIKISFNTHQNFNGTIAINKSHVS
jgi:hypothetical protein